MALVGERRAVQIIYEDMTGMQVYLLFTIVGDNYLQISSFGNYEFMPEVAQSVRPLGAGS